LSLEVLCKRDIYDAETEALEARDRDETIRHDTIEAFNVDWKAEFEPLIAVTVSRRDQDDRDREYNPVIFLANLYYFVQHKYTKHVAQ